MAKITLNPLIGSYASVVAINSRFQQIEDALNDDVLWRGGFTGEPNSMSVDLDVALNQILNVAAPILNNSPTRLQDLLDATSALAGSTTALLTTITDSGNWYGATTVEGALQEVGISGAIDITSNLAATTPGNGASLVGVEDSAGNFTGTDVEAVLAELAAAADFRGCLAATTGGTSLSTATWTTLVFASEAYDTDNIHDNVTNNTRVTVPAGVTKIRLTGITVPAIMTGVISLRTYKNGTPSTQAGGVGSYAAGVINAIMTFTGPIIEVVGGDYFELYGFQNSGGSLFFTSSFFGMEIIE